MASNSNPFPDIWQNVIPGITESPRSSVGGSPKSIGDFNDPAPTHSAAQSTEGDPRGKRIGESGEDTGTGNARGEETSETDRD